MRAFLVAAVALLLVGGFACSKKPSEAPEKGAEAEAPKELPGKVVKRTPEDPPPVPKEAPEEEAPAGPTGEDYPFLGTHQISEDAQLCRTIGKLEDAFSAKRIMAQLAVDKEKAIPALRTALRHRERNVRIQSAQILTRFVDKADAETTQAFIDALTKDPDGEVRAAVARAMRDYVDKALVDVLLAVLANDPHETTRANAAWALGSQGDKNAVPGLVAALDDPKTWVRLRSVSALKKLRAKKALPALLEKLRDENVTVRERALAALQKITGKKYGDDYERWKKVLRVK